MVAILNNFCRHYALDDDCMVNKQNLSTGNAFERKLLLFRAYSLKFIQLEDWIEGKYKKLIRKKRHFDEEAIELSDENALLLGP